MPPNAGQQRGCDDLAIRALPTVAAEMRHVGVDHQILHHIARVAFEARVLWRHRHLNGLLRVDHKLRSRLAPPTALLARPPAGFGSVAFSMPLGLMFGRPDPPLSRAISSRCDATV